MTILSRTEIDRFVAKPSTKFSVTLVYGTDPGLISERATEIASRLAEDASDPLQLIRMEGDAIAADPARLADEVHSVGLFGGRKSIRVRIGSKDISRAIAPLLQGPPPDGGIVLEAGDLKKSSPLRILCERSANAAVIACYADGPAVMRALIDDRMRQGGLAIDPDAADLLLSLLGADRLASRGEIEKVALYAMGESRVTVEDVEAASGDASATALGQTIDSAFSGKPAAMLPALAKLLAEGVRPDALLSAALNHAWALASALAHLEAGKSPSEAARAAAPYQRRAEEMERQLHIWRRTDFKSNLRMIGEALFAARSQADLSAANVDRMLLRIAMMARKPAH